MARLRFVLVTALVALLLLPVSRPETPRPAAPGPFGAYVGYGAEGVRRVRALSAWLGHDEPRVGHTYLPGDLWRNIEGAPDFVRLWARWRRAEPDRLLVLNVPMLDRAEGHLPDAEVRRRLRLGASGAYDGHFRALARRLVAVGAPDTVVVLGWEMNGVTYSHRCGPDPGAWKAYWARIVTAMRSVPGGRFRFDFAPNRGLDAIPWTRCYPGDRYVDIIGMDAYDSPRGLSFQEQADEPYGLRDQAGFARAHGKPVSYPEWGLYENGDDPAYLRGMLDWFARTRPVYQTLTDYCPHGVWGCRSNPRSTAVYRALMRG
ncbi:glycosyl hydrolase [Streptomyces sp. NPDC007851]|uniref:glycoside hydrolase family 26 protein n=1 Tax=Streptomyces sp. NPDC007851 TaxID=3155008 RepID=UPI003403E6EC